MDANKKKALDEAVLKIEKDFGKGAVMRPGDANAIGNVEVVPTGALSLILLWGREESQEEECWSPRFHERGRA